MTAAQVLRRLRALGDPKRVAGQATVGINTANAYGVSIPDLRRLARELRPDHRLALDLWATGVHEARILAGFVDDPARVTPLQMDRWAGDFDSWDVCDLVCANLFDRTPFAHEKARAWAGRDEEFVRRAGFALMAALAWHDKGMSDAKFRAFFPTIRRGARDERQMVKKAVSWALRQIGKRNRALRKAALAEADRIAGIAGSRAARWIASDVRRELTDPKTVARIRD